MPGGRPRGSSSKSKLLRGRPIGSAPKLAQRYLSFRLPETDAVQLDIFVRQETRRLKTRCYRSNIIRAALKAFMQRNLNGPAKNSTS